MPPHDLLLRDAAFRPASFDEEALSVEAVLATGAPIPRRDAAGPYLEILDLTGLELFRAEGVAVLDSHRRYGLEHVLGRVRELRVEGDELVGRIFFSRRPDVAPRVQDVRDGITPHLSVGFASRVGATADRAACAPEPRPAGGWARCLKENPDGYHTWGEGGSPGSSSIMDRGPRRDWPSCWC